jgi:hypothetical protein
MSSGTKISSSSGPKVVSGGVISRPSVEVAISVVHEIHSGVVAVMVRPGDDVLVSVVAGFVLNILMIGHQWETLLGGLWELGCKTTMIDHALLVAELLPMLLGLF